jgi:hypothetical protein
VIIAILAAVPTVSRSAPAAASVGPQAALSIDPASPALTIEFVAQAQNFPEPVVSYRWVFGDRQSATTTTATVTHAYASASVFTPSVTETDSRGDTATATATLSLNECPAGITQCTEALSNVGAIHLLQVTGPVSPASPAEANLLVGTFSFPNCESAIEQAAAVTDSGFADNLTLTISYTTRNPRNAQITCFSSTVAFVDASGALVNSGQLPACTPPASVAPCVESATISGRQVTKQLLIPPGDPKVGAP